jgi:hypothetical protein
MLKSSSIPLLSSYGLFKTAGGASFAWNQRCLKQVFTAAFFKERVFTASEKTSGVVGAQGQYIIILPTGLLFF